jgi:hypothetical protein
MPNAVKIITDDSNNPATFAPHPTSITLRYHRSTPFSFVLRIPLDAPAQALITLSSPISLEQPEQPPASGSCSLVATASYGFDEVIKNRNVCSVSNTPIPRAVFLYRIGLHVSIT